MENGERRKEGIGAKWKLSTGIEMKVQIGKWQQRHRVEPTGSFDEKQLPQPHNSYPSPFPYTPLHSRSSHCWLA